MMNSSIIREIPLAERRRTAAWLGVLTAIPVGLLLRWESWVIAAIIAALGIAGIALALRAKTVRVPSPEAAEVRAEEEALEQARSFAKQDQIDSSVYYTGALIVWVLTFIGCWIYCVAHYGFMLGVLLGWLPSLIVATIAAFLWPLLAIGVALIAGYVWLAT